MVCVGEGFFADAEEATHGVGGGCQGSCQHSCTAGDDLTVKRPVFVHGDTGSVSCAEDEGFGRGDGEEQIRHGFGRMLEISIHADHSFTLCFSEAANDGTAQSAFGSSYDDSNVVAFGLKLRNGFHRSIARVVVDNDHFDVSKFGRGSRMGGECGKETRDECSNVAVLSESGYDYGA